MKKIFTVLVISWTCYSADAQQAVAPTQAVDTSSRWCIDLNLKGGAVSQNITSVNFASNYLNALNDTISKLKFSNGVSYGFDLQVGYFFDKKKQLGVGTGIMFMWQKGDVTMDQFHIEYQSTDAQSPTPETFRQLITANGPIQETVSSTNISIPLLFKYKKQFSGKFGLAVDAGVLFNLQMKNSYSTNASFDYEAIYKYNVVGSNAVAVYDNSPTPGTLNEQYITKQQITQENSGTNAQTYFNNLRYQGYNVGLNQQPNSSTGTVSYKGSIGFLIQPSVSYKLNNYLSLNFGFYYMLQSFDNSANNKNYMLTDKVGSYNSLMNSASTSQNSAYGLNLGLRFYLDGLTDFLFANEPLR